MPHYLSLQAKLTIKGYLRHEPATFLLISRHFYYTHCFFEKTLSFLLKVRTIVSFLMIDLLFILSIIKTGQNFYRCPVFTDKYT